jgi:hypothetical protein
MNVLVDSFIYKIKLTTVVVVVKLLLSLKFCTNLLYIVHKNLWKIVFLFAKSAFLVFRENIKTKIRENRPIYV